MKVCRVGHCRSCPNLDLRRTSGAGDAEDWHCAAPGAEDRKIKGYIEWPSQEPKSIPDWCPLPDATASHITVDEFEVTVVLAVMHGAQCILNNLRDEGSFFGGGFPIHLGFGPQDKASGIAIAAAYGAINLAYVHHLRPAQ